MGSLTLNDVATVISLCSGIAAFVLSHLNFRRDAARVKVTLRWDMKVAGSPTHDPDKYWGVVSAMNVGRRPVFVSHFALCFPKASKDKVLLLSDSVPGRYLKEGDEPFSVIINQEDFAKYGAYWFKAYARVEDSTGKVWKSKPAGRFWKYRGNTKLQGPPSWAEKKDAEESGSEMRSREGGAK